MRSPRRHGSHRPQWPPNQPTPTRVPAAQPMTPLPTASITPAISCPGTIGYGTEGNSPSLAIESLWQTPHACTLTRTSPGPGCGKFPLDQLEGTALLSHLDNAHLRHHRLPLLDR